MATEQEAGSQTDPDIEDLYREFAERRRSSPVLPGPGAGDGFTVYRYEDCARVLRDPQTFSSAAYSEGVDLVFGKTILSMDDPEHKNHRDLVAHAFRQRALATWGDEVIGAVCHDLIDRFRPRGTADLVAELGNELPLRVTARILGLPVHDQAQFHRWTHDLLDIVADLERGFAASAALREYFADVVRERRAEPRDDVISDLVTAEIDGERLTDEAIYSFLRLLLPAGVETTARSIPALVLRLLRHPEQLEAVRGDRSLLPAAIEEGLRIDVPVFHVTRIVARDVEIAGVPVPAGAHVTVCLAAANRDETRWRDPDRFDIRRPFLQHLTFGAGAHMCLGQHLARIESTAVLTALLDRLPGLQLDTGRRAPRMVVPMTMMPGLDALPVAFGL
jgi:cytochrome P450